MRGCETIIQKALNEGRSFLLIDEAELICNLHEIPTPKFYVASDVDDAIAKAKEIGFPVVLKVISPQILHKSDVGGVVLNVSDEKELKLDYEKMVADVGKIGPSIEVKGIAVEEMMPPSTEVIIGGIRDSQFGPAIMFGIGGIFTEVYDDVAFRVAPIDRVDALNLIQELKGVKILEGFRGKPPVNLDSIVTVLVKVSDLMIDHNTISQLDLNPVIVYPDHVCAVDCRIIIEQKEGGK
ncbi:MAG: acetate--CoA ligase family protein [Nitrososphaeria archaeon]|jgi:acetyl-CoA synthetase (ADP-forming)